MKTVLKNIVKAITESFVMSCQCYYETYCI
jgi:hypothetical protein